MHKKSYAKRSKSYECVMFGYMASEFILTKITELIRKAKNRVQLKSSLQLSVEFNYIYAMGIKNALVNITYIL